MALPFAGLTQVYLSRQWEDFSSLGLELVVEDRPTKLSCMFHTQIMYVVNKLQDSLYMYSPPTLSFRGNRPGNQTTTRDLL